MKNWLVGFCLALSISGCSDSAEPKPKPFIQSPLPEIAAFDTRRIESPLVVEGDEEVARVVEILSKNLIAGYAGDGSLGPFGETNDRFSHHVFWDADVWVFPVLAFLDPESARRIPAFRLRTAQAAQRNFLKWKNEGYPTAKQTSHQPMPELTRLTQATPAMFPWEAKADGTEGSPSDTVFEHHVTGGVAWMLDKAIQLDLCDRVTAEKVIDQCASFYLHRLAKNPDGSYGILNVVSPSEWHTVNNDLYTNAIADWTIRRSLGSDKWPHGKVRLPRRGNFFATFDDDNKQQYQQAAALLAVYPLEHELVIPESRKMLESYRNRTAEFGPAMSRSINAVIAVKSGLVEQSLEEWRLAWEPYSRDLAKEFREKPIYGESYFLTGAAAALHVFIFGYLDMEFPPDPRGFKEDGLVTKFDRLPRRIKRVTLRTQVRGADYLIVSKQAD
ncbi:hypothetical protein QPK87_07125 [Kamptonema cortianum]|nr:hypothetical protein [Geitlerinema splendidum]MDK3156346.1 hypothetical protein [Kamptonema cortianum]